MTGGHPKTFDINKRLAEAAEELRVAIGVGSQRAAIEDPSLANTFSIVRETAPSVPVIANIGATHVNYASDAIEMIDADILAIHLNPLQEAVQPEGDCDSEGTIEKIAAIVDSVDIPVIVKETGAGISAEVASTLESIGVDAIDIGGVGGTSWSAVEYYRAQRDSDEIKTRLGKEFWNWGVPTALSLILVVNATKLEVIATGGIRTGLDVAKTLSLGATAAGIAHPLLNPAVNGTSDDVISELEGIIEGLRVAMYLTGCSRIEELASRPLIITGDLVECLRSLDIDYKKIASGS
jgi:isopentenyl-diphosphate delta-isomerase